MEQALSEVLRSIVSHQKNVMITFAVRTEGGAEPYQTPIIKPLSVKQTQEGHYVITGYNLRRLPDSPDDDVSSQAIIRSYRIDRILAHTLQFLNPAPTPVD
ncbi:MAG: hypothetical protein EP343_01910 [Deltaproteobacteria bacterium]|nr:MAG: hypothetical protein EP343_01910 [Deltaproteobacteria bacterium]